MGVRGSACSSAPERPRLSNEGGEMKENRSRQAPRLIAAGAKRRGRRPSHATVVACNAVFLALGVAVQGSLASGEQRHAAAAASSIRYTSRTIVVPRGTVKRYLVGVSLDGRKFKFSKLGGALARLKPGTELLLQAIEVQDVKKIARVKDKFVVARRPASLHDELKSVWIRVT